MYSSNKPQPNFTNPNKQLSLIASMRMVWEQHVYWTRMLLLSIAGCLGDEDVVTGRLLQNPKDIARIFGIYYGPDVRKTIEALLTEHLVIGKNLITALRDGKKAEAEELTRKWYKNADEMSEAFSGINPYFNREDLRKMLYTHLDLTTQEVAMRLAGNYQADVTAFDKVEQEALSMADYFSAGIMMHLPQSFR